MIQNLSGRVVSINVNRGPAFEATIRIKSIQDHEQEKDGPRRRDLAGRAQAILTGWRPIRIFSLPPLAAEPSRR
jgi:hypothetical protein